MGRRPRPTGAASGGLNLSQMSPEVREELNDIALMFFREAKLKMKDKIDKGEFKDLSLKELLKEFNSMVKSLQGPATSLTAIQLPGAPQEQVGQLPAAKRGEAIDVVAENPEDLEAMRANQQKFLEDRKNGET